VLDKADRSRSRIVVLLVRIELTTSPLPRECSTTELQQRAPDRPKAFVAARQLACNRIPELAERRMVE
jgi:hypothetical protein